MICWNEQLFLFSLLESYFAAVDQTIARAGWKYSGRRSSYNTKNNILAFK